MVFIVSHAQKIARPYPENKVIRAHDAWAYQSAREARAAGESRRDEIIAAASEAFEAEQVRGYREGREAAKLEQSGNMIELVSQTVDYFAKVEAQMADLVLEAVRHIASDFDDRQKVLKVVRNSLAVVRNQRQILVKVHPDQSEAIREAINSLKESFPSIEHIEIASDIQLERDACVIESDIGRVEASMSGQIEALRASFERVFSSTQNAEESEA